VVKKLFLALLLLGAGLWAYFQFFVPVPVREADAVERLSLFIDGQVDAILGPLPLGTKDTVEATSKTQELRGLREDIRDLGAKSSPGDKPRVTAAAQLCDSLLRASEERDKHLVRLNDTRAKNKPSALAGDPERDAAERLKFFENGIAHSWGESAAKLRASIDKQYAALRALERK
jgi:hypothetical protein